MSKCERSNARDDNINMTALILGSGLHPWSREKRAPFQKKKSHGTGYCAKHGLFRQCKLSTRFLFYPAGVKLKILPFFFLKINSTLKSGLDGK